MSILKKIQHPTFDVELPLTNATVKIRPFTVKEEKILLLAAETKDEKKLAEAFAQVIQNCVVESPEGFDVNKIWYLDFVILMLKIRCISVGTNSQVIIKYVINKDGKTEEKSAAVAVDLNHVVETIIDKAKCNPFSDTVNIDEDDQVFIKFKPLSYGLMTNYMLGNQQSGAAMLDLVYQLMEAIFVGEQSVIVSEEPKEEIYEWMDSLMRPQSEKIYNWVNDVPRPEYDIEFKDSDNETRKAKVRDLQAFFTL